jgi:hypothetical protein
MHLFKAQLRCYLDTSVTILTTGHLSPSFKCLLLCTASVVATNTFLDLTWCQELLWPVNLLQMQILVQHACLSILCITFPQCSALLYVNDGRCSQKNGTQLYTNPVTLPEAAAHMMARGDEELCELRTVEVHQCPVDFSRQLCMLHTNLFLNVQMDID